MVDCLFICAEESHGNHWEAKYYIGSPSSDKA